MVLNYSSNRSNRIYRYVERMRYVLTVCIETETCTHDVGCGSGQTYRHPGTWYQVLVQVPVPGAVVSTWYLVPMDPMLHERRDTVLTN
jgi:hypothetical protein